MGFTLTTMLAAGGLFAGMLLALTLTGAMSATLFVILDMEYPRFGLIRIDAANRTLVELQQSMFKDGK